MAKKNTETAVVPVKRDYNLTIDPSKLKKRTLPRMVLPKTMPVGAALEGKLLAVVPSPATTVKGECLHLQLPDGNEVLFPLTGVIRKALPDAVDLKGETIVLVRLEDIDNAKYGKKMYNFDVLTT